MSALDDIAAERQRQIDAEGWSPEHDDAHDGGQLSRAAGWYALNANSHEWNDVCGVADARCEANHLFSAKDGYYRWPFDMEWWRTKNQRSDLIRAAALLVAEIERIDRVVKP